jgi:hypothetical protein
MRVAERPALRPLGPPDETNVLRGLAALALLGRGDSHVALLVQYEL